jgi:autotransporter-associated beta strand protein
VPTNVATIPADSSPPTIIVDAPAYLDTLKMKDDTDNIIRIDNDMTIRFDDADTSGNIATLSMNNATLTVHQADSSFMQKIDGNGHLAKEGTGRVLLNGQLNFTGGFTVRNGDLAFRCGDYSATSMTVVNGGTARSHDVCATMPGTITINGDGYLGRGAIEFAAGTDIFAADVTVASDATIKILSGTTTFTGDILGSGILTIEASGGSTLDLDGLYNFAISSANANSMIADGGFVDIVDSTLSVSGEEAAGGTGIREFIIIDYSGGGTVSGRFGATNDLKVNWTIDYDGTEDNPGAVVLVQLPTTGSVLEFE